MSVTKIGSRHSTASIARTCAVVFLTSCGVGDTGAGSSPGAAESAAAVSRTQAPVPLKRATLLIEHNSTAEDTGFQAFVDGTAWKELEIEGPQGEIFSVKPMGKLKGIGLTELFFESEEPPNAEMPIPQLLAKLPPGDYAFEAKTVGGGTQKSIAKFNHKIPAGPQIITPSTDAVVSEAVDLQVSWSPGATPVNGTDINVTFYQLIVAKLGEPAHPGFGKSVYSVHAPSNVTSMRVPHEFLAPNSEYEFEVIAIEAGGNQTLTTSTFKTP